MKILVILLLLSTQIIAQTSIPLKFEHIDGLSQKTVYSITKDHQGFMWIATADGLNRFDGVEMKVYKAPPENKDGQMRGRVIRTRLIEDAQEQLWFATEVSIFSFNKKRERFDFYDFSDQKRKFFGLSANPVLLKDNSIWFANSSLGIIEFNTKTKENKRYPLNETDGRNWLIHQEGVYDTNDRLWFSGNDGLSAFHIKTKKWENYLQGQDLYGITYVNDTLFMGGGSGIIYFDIKNRISGNAFISNRNWKIKNDIFRCFYTDQWNNTWAGDEKGNVYQKPAQSASFEWMGNINGTEVNIMYPVYCFFMDESGTLWVGADVLGLMRTNISLKGFNSYPVSSGRNNSNKMMVLAIDEDKEGKILLGTYQQGVLVMDKITGKSTSLALPYPGTPSAYKNIATMIKTDSRGTSWIGYAGYLFVRKNGKNIFSALKIQLPDNALQQVALASCMEEYKDGWLLGTSLGLYFLSEKNGIYTFEHFARFGQTRISSLWVNGNKEVWIGYESRGLLIIPDFQKAEKGKNLFTEVGVKSILPDEQHTLVWISTTSGLVAWHQPSGKYKNFAEEDGLFNSYVYAALLHNNELWISTNNGLSKAKLNYRQGAVFPDIVFINFTTADGLPDNEFNTGAYLKGKDGSFYFGTLKGVVWFRPEEIKAATGLPQIRMINLLVNEEKADSTVSPEYITELSLPYFKNNLFFRFRGIELNNPQKVNYAYQMEGWDKDWVYSKTLNEVRYNKLPPGNYTFKIKAANGSGIWSKEIYTVQINIHPPFWKTWWFYILAGFLFLAAVIIITRIIFQKKLRKKVEALERQREIDKERQRISREMHDDIGAGLTQITLMSEFAKNKNRDENEKELADIANTSRKLVSNMSEIIWSLNPDNKSLEQLMAYLREQLNKLLEYSGLTYNIALPENGKDILLNNQQRRNILLVTKEIVHNAIKHSGAKKMSIKAIINNGSIEMEIADDGKGFDTEIVYGGNGLKNIRQRVEEMGGELTISSETGKGSRFSYTVFLSTT